MAQERVVDVDVMVVGAGPAGLSAALVLGRCRRRTLLCDAGEARNRAAHRVHGYLGLPDSSPEELREIGRRQLASHANVEVREVEVVDVERSASGFVAHLRTGESVRARKVLLATGVDDEMPAVPGLSPLWGRNVFPCPYCDGWEFRGGKLAALAIARDGSALTRALTTWSNDVVLFTTEPLEAEVEGAFERHGVRITRAPVLSVEAEGDGVRLILQGAAPVYRDAVFVAGGQSQKTNLLARLGCKFTDTGMVDCGPHQSTCVPGLYVAGDAAANIQFAIIAAAEGASAAFAINREILREDFGAT